MEDSHQNEVTAQGGVAVSTPAAPGRALRARVVEAAEVPEFARTVLLDPARTLPVVGLTTRGASWRPDLDADGLAERLGDRAIVIVLPTKEATWALNELLPERLDVYGGAARIWWPGLSATSSWREHPLLFIWSLADVPPVERRILGLILGEDAATDSDAGETGTVERVEGGRVFVRFGGEVGAIAYSDFPLAVLAASVRSGQGIRVRSAGRRPDGEPVFTTRELLPSAWRRIHEGYHVGDVVPAVVERLRNRCAVVELLPGATAVVPIKEIDWDFVRHPADVLAVGDVVPVEILDLSARQGKCLASIRAGRKRQPRPGLALIEGGPPFAGEGRAEPVGADAGVERALRERIEELESELAATAADRTAALRNLGDLRRQNEELRRAARGAVNGVAERTGAGPDDPLASERAFLRAVRVAYARAFDEGDRAAYPLQRMRVGREFLASLRALDGIAIEKVVEVSAQVACLRAHEIPGREVHPLRSGEAGAPSRARSRDNAKAWRCSLQDNTPSARRLHWWDVPGERGRTIEFACVGLHDDFGIPE